MDAKGKLSTEAYKGVRDFYPEEEAVQKYIFSTMRDVVERTGYVEYNASILEPAELYRSKTSDEIVNEQTYTFVDRGEREVTLRPEMTPSVARMVAARRRELPFPLRWYSVQNFFRYERPQRGRVREFWQLNVDLFGSANRAAEVEMISLSHAIMIAFGAQLKDFEIRVSSRAFLNGIIAELELPAQNAKALLRLLDRRAKISPEEFETELLALGVPLSRIESADMPADVAEVLAPLHKAGHTNIVYDPSVVRGFDYYTGIVFEVFDTHPENNRALFGGGRYDNLLSLFGEDKIPAVGFGMGDVTIREFLAVRDLIPPFVPPTKVYVAVVEPDLVPEAMVLAEELRAGGINTAVDLGDKKLGDQIKAADKMRIPYLIVVGRDELASGEFALRELATRQERRVSREELASLFLTLG